MIENDLPLCDYCTVGYYPPLDRFERVATIASGPSFLNRCKICGTLWDVDLRSARVVNQELANELYPGREF
jgi:hypothetical protein